MYELQTLLLICARVQACVVGLCACVCCLQNATTLLVSANASAYKGILAPHIILQGHNHKPWDSKSYESRIPTL